MKKNTFLLLLLFLVSTASFSNSFVHLDSLALAQAKTRILTETASAKTLATYHQLLKKADQLLDAHNPTVTDKTILPPSGDKHDYLSISRYWWPDATKKDGLPWIRRDGETNPDTQTDAVDRKRLGFMGQSVRTLSLAYYFTDDEKYAAKAITMLHTWFIDPDTQMNPHLDFAQSVPGNPKKRRSGILDGRMIVMNIPDAIPLLSSSKQWTRDYTTNMRAWLSDYLIWLTESKLGIQGSTQENNHGSWYKYQVATLAYYLDRKDLVQKMVKAAEHDLENQLNEKGGQVHELERSRSYFYSCFNLQALSAIADLGDKVGLDMWHYESESGKSLALAINYLTPAVDGASWPHNTLKEIDFTDLIPILTRASDHLSVEEYRRLLAKVVKEVPQKQNTFLQEFWLIDAVN